jgi:hypothetical protein
MARSAVGLTVTSTTIGSEGFRNIHAVADPVNAAGTAQDAVDIATSSTAITATAVLIATDNTNLATDATNIGTDNTNLGTTDNTAVEAAVAALEGDPADQGSAAHVATLRTVWNTMKGHLTSLNTHNTSLGTHRTSLGTHSGTATSDASTLATRSASLTADVAPTPAATDVVISFDSTAVGSRSVLRRAVEKLLDQAVPASNTLTP